MLFTGSKTLPDPLTLRRRLQSWVLWSVQLPVSLSYLQSLHAHDASVQRPHVSHYRFFGRSTGAKSARCVYFRAAHSTKSIVASQKALSSLVNHIINSQSRPGIAIIRIR